MKKNLLSIIILALLIANIILTSVMMFSVVGASKKTSALVTDIASVLQLELSGGAGAEAEVIEEIPMSQTEVYNIPDPMTISLKKDEDGKATWCILSVALSINNKDKGYKKYYENLATTQTLIMSEITDVVGQYTKSEIESGAEVLDGIRKEILKRVQAMFESEFIYNISFSDIKCQ